MDDLIPLEPLFEIEGLLPQHQPAAEHVMIGIDNVPVRQTPSCACAGGAGRTARNQHATRKAAHAVRVAAIAASCAGLDAPNTSGPARRTRGPKAKPDCENRQQDGGARVARYRSRVPPARASRSSRTPRRAITPWPRRSDVHRWKSVGLSCERRSVGYAKSPTPLPSTSPETIVLNLILVHSVGFQRPKAQHNAILPDEKGE